MRSIEIPERKTFLYMPEHLGECDPQQYAHMAKLIWMFQTGEISYEEFRSLAVYSLLNLKPSGKKDPEIHEKVFILGELVDSFFEQTEKDGKTELKILQFYVNNHLPKIKAGFFQTFYGPEDIFEDVEFGQYVDGLEEFINYSQTGDKNYLCKLFAIFYLKKGEQYDAKVSRNRAKSIFRITDIRHLYGFYLYFSAMQLFIMSGEIYVQGQSIDLSIIYEPTGEESKSNIPGIGMFGLLNDLAESGVFGPYHEIRRANFWAVQKRLYQIQKKQLDEKPNQHESTAV